jgi:hypothetical protein
MSMSVAKQLKNLLHGEKRKSILGMNGGILKLTNKSSKLL